MFQKVFQHSGCQGVVQRLQKFAVSALRPETVVGRCGEEHEERCEEDAEGYQEREAVLCSVCTLTSPSEDELIMLIPFIVLSKDQSFSSKAFRQPE
jgi:hypothetical protein